jgi:hypothetical protein
MMKYVKKRGVKYHFVRRVPKDIRAIDDREFIQVSLKTDSANLAQHRATILNQHINAYWESLIIDPSNKEERFKQAVHLARLHGFGYKSAAEIAHEPVEKIIERVIAATSHNATLDTKKALLGAVEHPAIKLSSALEKFWTLSKDKQLKKSTGQIQKWKNPRIKAMKNFINIVGDKNLADLTRNDALNFKDWWVERLQDENMTPNSANKDFIHLRGVLLSINDNLRLDLPIHKIFERLTIKDVGRTSRLSFEPSFVQDTLLSRTGAMTAMNEKLWLFVCAMSDTGARINELVGLDAAAGDICLDDDIPYIHIRPNQSRQLKTPDSERVIPLVGASLYAFQQLPQGFVDYHGRPDSLSSAINKWFRDNDILPSSNHSLYSLRHCFQDRLISVEAPDRIQAELMGHKFHRPRYGAGASLEQKQKWLERIALTAL